MRNIMSDVEIKSPKMGKSTLSLLISLVALGAADYWCLDYLSYAS